MEIRAHLRNYSILESDPHKVGGQGPWPKPDSHGSESDIEQDTTEKMQIFTTPQKFTLKQFNIKSFISE